MDKPVQACPAWPFAPRRWREELSLVPEYGDRDKKFNNVPSPPGRFLNRPKEDSAFSVKSCRWSYRSPARGMRHFPVRPAPPQCVGSAASGSSGGRSSFIFPEPSEHRPEAFGQQRGRWPPFYEGGMHGAVEPQAERAGGGGDQQYGQYQFYADGSVKDVLALRSPPGKIPVFAAAVRFTEFAHFGVFPGRRLFARTSPPGRCARPSSSSGPRRRSRPASVRPWRVQRNAVSRSNFSAKVWGFISNGR